MNRISGGQLAALILVSDAFTLICISGGVSLITTASFLVGILLQFVMTLPIIKYYNSGGTLKYAPKSFLWFYLGYILLWGGLLFVMIWNTADELSIPSHNFSIIPEKLLLSGLIALVCLYASSPGVRPLSRAAVVSAALGALCIVIVIIGAIPRFSIDNLNNTYNSQGFFHDFAKGFVLSGGLGSFIIYLGYTKTSPMKCTVGYFIGKAVLYTAVTITVSAVAGGIMKISDFPVITAAEISQPFSTQRIDSLFLIVFAILAVFAISAQTEAAAWILGVLFPDFTRFRSTITLILMIGAAFLISGIEIYNIFYSIAVVTSLFIVPLIMYRVRKREGAK